MANLDMRASENLGCLSFTLPELIALALGLQGSDTWFKLHNVDRGR